jgi:hypothetical protein
MHVDQHFAGMTPEELAVFRMDVILDFPTPRQKGHGMSVTTALIRTPGPAQVSMATPRSGSKWSRD